MQVHGCGDGNVLAHDLAHAGGDHALAVLLVHHTRGAVDGEQHGVERLLVMGLLEQRAKLVEPRVEELVGHRATGKGAGIGKGHPLDALDAPDVAKALKTRGIDCRGIARNPRMAVEQLLTATDAEGGLTRAIRRELGTLDMEATDGDTIGFGHDNHAPKDRGYQTVPLWRMPRRSPRTFARSQHNAPPAAMDVLGPSPLPAAPAIPLIAATVLPGYLGSSRSAGDSKAHARGAERPESAYRTMAFPAVIHREYRPLELPFLVFMQPDH